MNTSSDHIQLMQQQFKQQQLAYTSLPYPTCKQRQQWLNTLLVQLKRQEKNFCEAICQDFSNRSVDETRIAEIIPSLSAIKYCIKHLNQWMQPTQKRVGLLFQPAKAYTIAQPLGVIGIIVPWNYPLYLAIGPLCQALAAGNRVMLKMSESTPQFSAHFKQSIEDIFPNDLVHVITGDAKVAQSFSQLPFDHLFFTGSTAIGKKVMQSAADNLTPVTLELGGKSPALIAIDADLHQTVERIAFGKAMNAGQTCIAPDYVLIPKTLEQTFIRKYLDTLETFYPSIHNNPDYTAIINNAQLERLYHYIDDAEQNGATIHRMKGQETARKMAHCIIQHSTASMKIRHNEIFGPILPIIGYDHFEDALTFINQGERPLALYYFGHNHKQQQVLQQTHSGGICFNETLMHVAQEDLAFGGVGASGMGSYHGIEGFKTFSHEKSVFVRPKLSFMKMIYPPYGKWIQKKLFKLYFNASKD